MLAPRLSAEFQWFLIVLSVRPGRYLASSDHLLPPSLPCSSTKVRSSSIVLRRGGGGGGGASEGYQGG